MASKNDLEQVKASTRLAFHFLRTTGISLGCINKSGEIVKGRESHFKEIENEALSLLKKGWSEAEIESIIFQSYRDKKKPSLLYELFLGKTPISNKLNPERNLLEDISKEELLYHKEIAIRSMPRLSLSGIVKEKPKDIIYKSKYTLRELRFYWESYNSRATLIQVGLEADKAFAYLLDKYNVSEILNGIDSYINSIDDIKKVLNIFKLNNFIVLKSQEIRYNLI